MLVAFIEAVLRSLILALIVWAALRIFRVQNVVSQRYAWIGVLVGSLLMPFALPFTARWQVLPLATIPAPTSLGLHSVLAPTTSRPASGADSFAVSMTAAPQNDHGDAPQTATPTAERNRDHAISSQSVQLPGPGAASAQPVAVRRETLAVGCCLARVLSDRRHTPGSFALWLGVRIAPLVFLHSRSIGRRHAH